MTRHRDSTRAGQRTKKHISATSIQHMARMAILLAGIPIATLSMAKEIPTGQVPATQSDWTTSDRMAWNTWRKSAIAGSLPLAGEAARRFYEAFKVNLKQGKDAEYQTILQRHSMYDAMSFTLHRAEDVDRKLRCIRFFDAAADVTSETTLGSAETLVGQTVAGLSAETVKAIGSINQGLFQKNIGVMKSLLLDWKEPRDPNQPGVVVTPISFDLQMVQFEQSAVEAMLTADPSLKKKNIIDQVSDLKTTAQIAAHYFSGQGGPNARMLEFRTKWLPAVGIPSFSFDSKEHRVALGEAYVLFLHGHGLEQYKALRKDRVVPSTSCKGTLP